MRYINELREGDNVAGIYLCKQKTIQKTKAGKTYYSLILQDKTGVIDTKIWELNNGIDNFEQMDYIRVDGNVTSFQGSLQMNVRRLRRAREGEYLPQDYIPCSAYDIDKMYRELSDYVNSVQNRILRGSLKGTRRQKGCIMVSWEDFWNIPCMSQDSAIFTVNSILS